MKKIVSFITALIIGMMNMQAMSYEEARDRALFLTDKMAYELNLNDAQYNDAYQINLDYLMNIRTASDVNGIYWQHRNRDLGYILYDWQYTLFRTAEYFLRPIVWKTNRWYYPIYSYYHTGVFYYKPPRVFNTYKGGKIYPTYHQVSFYINRRPTWNGGFRGKGREAVVHHKHKTGIPGPGFHIEAPKNRPSTVQREQRPNLGKTQPATKKGETVKASSSANRNEAIRQKNANGYSRPSSTRTTVKKNTQSGPVRSGGKITRDPSSVKQKSAPSNKNSNASRTGNSKSGPARSSSSRI